MENQKLDNQLNLALDSTQQEREQSLDLDVGFNSSDDTWELIVKYSGNLSDATQELNMKITYLLAGYAVVRIPQEQIALLAELPQIEFIEKPKGLFWEQTQEMYEACIYAVKRPPYSLNGKGTLVAVIDSGIDISHREFRNPDGTTRIAVLWDQTIAGNPPEGYQMGTVYTREQINEALKAPEGAERLSLISSVDLSGHGTHVAGIAAGRSGVASEAELIIVKLGNTDTHSFPRTTQLMTGVNFVIQFAEQEGKPVAINLSFGNNYGGHDGSSLLETFLNNAASASRNVIICGTGNEGANGRHAGGVLEEGSSQRIEFSVADYEMALNLQIWKSYADVFGIYLIHPTGRRIGPVDRILGTQRFTLGNTKILLYFGEPAPYNRDQEIYIEFLPTGNYLDSGIWSIEFVAEKIVSGRYDLWLPVAEATGNLSRFLYPDESITLTIPSTAEKVVSVAAYESLINAVAPFSGRGFTRRQQIKPDLAAPGVNIRSATLGGGYSIRSGTSMAAPFVTGAAALLMQYGIVDGRDPWLYGEKLKAYLVYGARQIEGVSPWPNRLLGWGTLCVANSLQS